VSSTPVSRRAVDRRGELSGAGLSALMAVLFAFVVIAGKDILEGDLPFVVLSIRFAGQTILLLVVLLLLRRPLVPETGERVPLVLAATLGYGSESAFFFTGVTHGSAAAITLLFYTYPVWVMLATIVVDRRAPAGELFVALGLAIAGSAIVVIGGGELEVETVGIVLALATSFTYTGYLMATDRFVKRTDPLTAATWLGAGAAAANLVYGIAFGAVDLPPSSAAPNLALMALFSAGAFVAMIGGLQRLGAMRNAIIGVMEPLTVAVLAFVFLGEAITWSTATGGVLILVGAVIATTVRTTRIAEPNV
jgi:drug/metabolite transporter (DMT)-like permease